MRSTSLRLLNVITPIAAIAALLPLCFTDPAVAEQVGTAVVDGRTVIIEGDGTWRYADATAPGSEQTCDKLKGMEVCVKQAGWQTLQKMAQFEILYGNGGKYYMGIILEPYGTKDGVNYKTLQGAIINNAATGSGTTVAQIPVLSASEDVTTQPGAKSVTYAATMSGTPFVFHNVFKLYDNQAIQIVFWGIGKSVNEEFSQKINEALSKVKMD